MKTLHTAAVFAICATATLAQWLDYPTPGIPRTKDGKPDLSAAAPRGADGKVDLSGLYQANNARYFGNIAADFKPGETINVTEAHVIHAASVPVSREHRRAKTDRLDTEQLKRS